MSLRIALVTYNWPPRNAIGTHRPYAWAKYWTRLGVKVTVLTARKQDFDQPLDSHLPALPGVKVIEVDYRAVASIGRSLQKDGGFQARVSFLKALNRLLRAKLGLVLDPRDRWADRARDAASVLANEVDVVVSTFGPRSAHLVASRMKRQVERLLWVADYRDLWSNSHMAGYGGFAAAGQQRLEKRTVASADFLTTVSAELAEDLRVLLEKPVLVVPNGFDPEEDVSGDSSHGDGCRLVYTGMLYPGTRDPSPLFAALAKMRLQDPQLKQISVEFYGPPNAWLTSLIKRYQLEGVVNIHGRVTRSEALSLQRSADVLLLLESGEPAANGVLTGKLFEYLAAGRPILSLGSRGDSAIARVIGETGAGICVGEDEQLVESTIRDLLANPEPHWFRPKPEKIALYSRKEQAELLLVSIQSCLAKKRK